MPTTLPDISIKAPPLLPGLIAASVIPSKLVIPVIQDLEKYGEVRRPFLGIEMKSLTDIASYHWSQTLKLPKGIKTGAVIMFSVFF
jgi:S1-C subfamily serine protease